MGLAPEYPDYEEGDECEVCVDILFDGSTPKYVEAYVTGVTLCPGAPSIVIDGTFLLTQSGPCVWGLIVAGILYTWTLRVGQSVFGITSGPAIFFSSIVNDDCYDAFVNQNGPCNWPFIAGTGGYVLLYWGPTIGP